MSHQIVGLDYVRGFFTGVMSTFRTCWYRICMYFEISERVQSCPERYRILDDLVGKSENDRWSFLDRVLEVVIICPFIFIIVPLL